MSLNLMYITNNPEVAKIADRNGVDRIFIDLETRGKAERQGHIDSVKSHHNLTDIDIVKGQIERAGLLVRCNPLYEGSRKEIDEIISRGADIVMLPMWKTTDDARRFIDYVGGRVRTMLLLETIGAEKSLDEVLNLDGIDEIHIGLNDLHLDYGLSFLFELLANGKVDEITAKLRNRGVFFGFGGIATLDGGLISGRNIIAEHYRLGSQMAILSRAFCDTSKIKDPGEIERIFSDGVKGIRQFEKELCCLPVSYFEENHLTVCRKVNEIVDRKRNKE